jgi:putative endonuclease
VKDPRCQTGREGEDAAVRYLSDRGLRVHERNFRCAIGEIDIVCLDGDTIVFVEVRSHSSQRFGLPQESITLRKRQKLTRLAQWYLKKNGLERRSARFDVVAVTWKAGTREVIWIVNAFEACS